jgi:hypothetical protein
MLNSTGNLHFYVILEIFMQFYMYIPPYIQIIFIYIQKPRTFMRGKWLFY